MELGLASEACPIPSCQVRLRERRRGQNWRSGEPWEARKGRTGHKVSQDPGRRTFLNPGRPSQEDAKWKVRQSLLQLFLERGLGQERREEGWRRSCSRKMYNPHRHHPSSSPAPALSPPPMCIECSPPCVLSVPLHPRPCPRACHYAGHLRFIRGGHSGESTQVICSKHNTYVKIK